MQSAVPHTEAISIAATKHRSFAIFSRARSILFAGNVSKKRIIRNGDQKEIIIRGLSNTNQRLSLSSGERERERERERELFEIELWHGIFI